MNNLFDLKALYINYNAFFLFYSSIGLVIWKYKKWYNKFALYF